MTFEEVKALPQIKFLSDREINFLEEYIKTESDWFAALKRVYNPQEKQMTTMSKRLQARPFLMQTIRQIDGVYLPKKDDLIGEGWMAALTSDGPTKVAALQFVARLSGHFDEGDSKSIDKQQLMRDLDNAFKPRSN